MIHSQRLARTAGALVLALVAGGWGCTRAEQGATPARPAGGPDASAKVVPVVAAVATRRDVPILLEGLGSVAAYYTVTVKAQVSGILQQVAFREGQAVHRGDLLAQIDPRPFEIQLHNAEGALAKDEAALKGDELDLRRYQDLLAQKLVSQQQVDDQAAVVGQAEGAVKVDKAAIESAKLNLAWSHITSPIDGVTGVRQVDPGNVVQTTDANGIVVLTQLDPIALYITLPEDVLPSLEEQMHKQTTPLAVEAWSRDGATKLGTGKLLLVDNQINQSTATLRLKAVLPNPQRTLWPNQFVKAKLHLETVQNALVVPSAAVQRGPDGTFAYVVGADQTVQPRPVEVSLTQGELAIIGKGLDAGDQVVTDGQNQLRAGSKVKAHVVGSPPVLAEQGPPVTGQAQHGKRPGKTQGREE
jgi:multidrug efflux system membrane fusion protein